MSNFTITLEVKPTPELLQLFAPLIAVLQPKQQPTAVPAQMPQRSPVAPVVTPAPQYQPPVQQPQYTVPVQQAPVNPTPAPQPSVPVTTAIPVATSQPAPMPCPSNQVVPQLQVAPTAATPAYDLETIARAAGAVSDAGKRQEVSDLITAGFGIQTLSQLPKERYGEFATALRQMGARI
jgi:hypothetical protein